MTIDVLCLRPEADFRRVAALPPASLKVVYRGPSDLDVAALMKQARACVNDTASSKASCILPRVTQFEGYDLLDAMLDAQEQAETVIARMNENVEIHFNNASHARKRRH